MEIDVFTRTDSPYWFASLTENGQRKKASLKLPAKGRHAVKRQVALKAAEALQATLSAPAIPSLRQALDAYCDYLEAEGKPFARNAKTLRDKLLGLRAVVRQKAGAVPAGFHLDPAMPVSELTPQLLTKLVDARRKEGCAAQTITYEIGVLRAAVRHATARGGDIPRIVVENTWAAPKVLQKTRYLEWHEWQRLYEALSPDRAAQFAACEADAEYAIYCQVMTQFGRKATRKAMVFVAPPLPN